MNNSVLTVALTALFITVFAGSRAAAKMLVSELKCENLVNPNAIDNTKPHFSWKVKSESAMRQQAYEIQVASDSALLQSGRADLWNPGKVNSPASVMVPYKGDKLSARSLCYWRVRIWNEKGEASAWTAIARFGVGLLSKSDMQGSFIGLTGVKNPILRKKFTVADKNTSFLYVNSLGYHEVYLNGGKVSKDVLSPAVSQLNKRSVVVTYDVTSHLQPGENELVIWLGQGWYKQSAWDRVDIAILDGPVVRAQLDVRQRKAWRTLLITDSSWQGRAGGYEDTGSWNALRFGGENVNAASNPKDLYPATLDRLTWQPAAVRTAHDHEIIPEMTEPNRIREKIPAKSITKIDAATWLIDMGKSVNGWLEWRVPSLPKGQQISICYSDDINADGTWLDMAGGQSDRYTASGEDGEAFCNKFNHHAFRYVKICNIHAKPELEDVNAYLIHTDYKAAASFECSDSDMNVIHDMVQYTMRCLAFAGYMVDCPHLERAGYGGDGNSSLLSLQTMYDVAPLFT
ncbi:MAG: family 78 glycoside hydrolase catalytic domain, partial [Prevotellaceae bacterium]|nr:family 78 glycoside hydrolase catalytic domain [Prevotellaceae bacterium]